MSIIQFTEDSYELALIDLFQSLEGKLYRYAYVIRTYISPDQP